MVRLGTDPPAFSGKLQWPDMRMAGGDEVAARIGQWANSLPQFSDKVAGALIALLRTAQTKAKRFDWRSRSASLLGLSPLPW